MNRRLKRRTGDGNERPSTTFCRGSTRPGSGFRGRTERETRILRAGLAKLRSRLAIPRVAPGSQRFSPPFRRPLAGFWRRVSRFQSAAPSTPSTELGLRRSLSGSGRALPGKEELRKACALPVSGFPPASPRGPRSVSRGRGLPSPFPARGIRRGMAGSADGFRLWGWKPASTLNPTGRLRDLKGDPV